MFALPKITGNEMAAVSKMSRKSQSKKGQIRHGAMLRAKYFPPISPQMCREYCPICKRQCVFATDSIGIASLRNSGLLAKVLHMCPMEHKWYALP